MRCGRWRPRGGGAYAGDRRLTGSATTELRDALVSLDQFAFGPGSAETNARRHRLLAALVPEVQRVRIVGASAIDLAWTAEGRQNACVLLGTKPWDTAAGVLVAREAGVRVVDLDGAEHLPGSGSVVAVAAALEDTLLAVLRGG